MSADLKVSKQTMIKWIITIVIPLIVYLFPTNEVYTNQMRLFIVSTVFFLLILAFELFDVIVPSVLMPISWGIISVAPLPVIMAPWTSTTMYMCLGSLFLANVLTECGLLKRISYLLMSKTGGNYLGLLVGIFVTGVVLTMVTFGNGYIIMAALCLGVCRTLNLGVGKASAAIAMACMLGTCSSKCFVYCPTIYAILVPMARTGGLPEFDVTFFQSIAHNWPMAVVSLLIIVIIGKWYKADKPLDSKEHFQTLYKELGPTTMREKKAVIVLAIIMVYLLTVSIHKMDTAYGFAFLPWLFLLPGMNVCTTEGSVKNINFSILFFIAGCMSIGVVATHLGFGTILAQMCLPLFQDASVFKIFGLVFGIVFGLNFLMTPMAIWSLLTGPLVGIAIGLGQDPRPFMYALVHCAEAIILPYEYMPYLVVYSFGMISMKDFVKLNLLRCILYFLGFMCLLIPYWMLIGVIRPYVG